MRSTRRRAAAALAAAALALLAAAAPAGAQLQAVETTIDLNYTYEQEHLGDDVTAATGFQQKYEVRLETSLTSSLVFFGAVTVDLDDKWDTDAAATSRLSPSLELGRLGAAVPGEVLLLRGRERDRGVPGQGHRCLCRPHTGRA